MKRNVMIFSGGSYPGIEVYFALKDSLVFHPIMASSYSDHSRFVTYDYIENMPFTHQEDFVEKINRIINDRDIEFIIPTHDTIALVLMENEHLINATIVCSPYETAKVCRYKNLMYEMLKDCNFTPKTFTECSKEIAFPLFAKPIEGQGSVGVKIINNETEFSEIAKNSSMIICEYLPGEEFTIDCFTNRYGELIFINPRKRSRIQYGLSARTESVEDETTFIEIANQINRRIKFRGYWFVQLKKDASGLLKLLEVSTRFSGSFNHSQALGVNLPLMALYDFAGYNVQVIKNSYKVTSDKTFIERYDISYKYDRVYIDYDDTITQNNGLEVNSLIIAFLYQCKNSGCEIVLLTRHSVSKETSLFDDLKRLSISPNLFHSVIDIDWNQEKADFIELNKKSIFIDNSFIERKKVFEKIGIPVFDVNHVICLLDWRN